MQSPEGLENTPFMLTNLVFRTCEYNHRMSQDYKIALFLLIQVITQAPHFEYIQPSDEQKLHHDLIFTQ